MSERAHRQARLLNQLLMSRWSPRVVLFVALGVWNAVAGHYFFGRDEFGWWLNEESAVRFGLGLGLLWLAQHWWRDGG